MKRFFLILLIFVSLDVVAQNDYFKIKEGSFTHVVGAVMDDAKEHTDVDNKPMALFKISTENINDEERRKLYFTGNRVTEISDKVYKTGSVWIYITAEHSDFLEIRHPDYGVTRFYFPESLCDFCTYEMVLQYIDPTPAVETGFLAVSTEPNEADVYVDGKSYGKTTAFITDLAEGSHTLKLEKNGCATITKTITIKENETLTVNEKLQTGKEITIKTDKSGDKVYVDDNYVGLSPVTTSLAFGSHNIKAERDGKTVSKNIEVSHVETHGRVSSDKEEYMLTFVQKINGHEYVDLGLSVKWATCNVGASKPEDYGNDYAWGETSTKSSHTSDSSKTYGKQMNDIKGNSQYDAARANWGGTWRLPTGAELEELKNKCTWRWTTQNGVKGYKVTGPNGNSIFLSAAGCRLGSSLDYAGEYGCYWSSTPYESTGDGAYYLGFDSGDQGVVWYRRDYGRSVRPVAE